MAANTEGIPPSYSPQLRLEPPGEIPSPPASNSSKYAIDVHNRVVRADFSRDERLDPVDEAYVLGLFERPDLTVIIKGLAKRLDPTIWNTRYLAERCGTIMYHNFRRFRCGEEDPGGAFVAIPEVEKAWSSMRLCDYVRYLDERAEAARSRAASKSPLSSPPGAPSVGSSSSTRTPSESSSSTRAPQYADQSVAPIVPSAANKKPASPRGASSSSVSTSAGIGGGGVLPQASPEKESMSPDAAAAAAAADSSSSSGALGSASTLTIAASRPSRAADSDVTMANQRGEQDAFVKNGNGGNPGGGISEGNGIRGVDGGGGEGGRGRAELEPSMEFTSFDGKPRTVNLLKESVYLTDMDLTRYLPECANNLGREFMMDIMPGGSTCAMQYMPRESRPFLGPNLYITPPGSWTHFHQDGNGTVDSGHQCLAGRNRVIMLRRLDEDNKRRALRILAGDLDLDTNSSASGRNSSSNGSINGNDSSSGGGGGGGGLDPDDRTPRSTSEKGKERAEGERQGCGIGGKRDNDAEGASTSARARVQSRTAPNAAAAEVPGHESAAIDGGGRGACVNGAGAAAGGGAGVFRGEGPGAGAGGRSPMTAKGAFRRGGGAGTGAAVPDVRRGEDMLYRLPHGPGRKPPWPSEAAIDRLRELNFCPSVFTLEPGEFVHINKGRLHAFRKETPLPNQDPGSVCVSVAWDWVFQGVTEAGCKEELSYALRCAADNRRAQASSLAPVETCLLQAAKASLASLRVRSSLLGGGAASSHADTAVGHANGSARGAGAGAAALSDPSGGAIVTEAGVLRRQQSSTPHPPLSTSPLPLLELLSRLQDLVPSEAKTHEDRVPRHGLGGGIGVDADEATFAAAAVAAPTHVPPTGLDSWVMPHPVKNCGVLDDDSVKAEPVLGCTALRSSALEVAIRAAREVLETGAPAAREAEDRAKAFEAEAEAGMLNAAKARAGGVSPASRSRSASAACSAAGRSAMAAARMATEAVAAALNTSTAVAAAPKTAATSTTVAEAFPRAVVAFLGSGGQGKEHGHASSFVPPGGEGEGEGEEKGDPSGGGKESGASVGSAPVAAVTSASAASEAEMLSALAPLLEEIVARQRSEWDLQAKAMEDSEKPPVLDPFRPGKRKLGPAAAKARDDAIVAVMQKMEKPIKRAVDVVEVDSSVPMHLQKINPFSGDDGFSCSSCRTELFNAYMHCYGCEVLLSKDLNLCLECHASGKLAFPPLREDEHGLTDRLHCPSIPAATLLQRELKANGQRSSGQWPASRCGCHEESCRQCHLCVLCACDCHHRFQLRFRFEHPEHLERFVVSVRDAAGGDSTIPQHLSHHRHDALGDGRGGGGSGSGSSTGGGKGLDKSDPGNAAERSRNKSSSSNSSSERRNSEGGKSGGSVGSTSEESRAERAGETASSSPARGGGGGVNVEDMSVSPPEADGEGEEGDGETAANASEQTRDGYRRRHRGHGARSQSRGQGRVRGGANNSSGDLASSADDNDAGDGDSESSNEAAGDIPGAGATKATSSMRSKAGSRSSISESGGSGSSGSGSSSGSENDGEVPMLRGGGKRQGGALGDSDSTSAGAGEAPLSRGSAPSSGAEGRIAGVFGDNRSASAAAEEIRRRKRKRKSVDGGGDGAPDRSDDGYDNVYDDVIPRFRDPVERDNSYSSASGRGRAKTSSAGAGRGKNVSGASVGRKARKVSIDGGSAAVRVALVEEGGGGGDESFTDAGSSRRLDKARVSVSSSSASGFSEGVAMDERRERDGNRGGARRRRSSSEASIPRSVVGEIDDPRRSGGGSSSDPELEAFAGDIDTPGRRDSIFSDRRGIEEPDVSARGGAGNGSESARAEASAESTLDAAAIAVGGGVARAGGCSKKERRGGESGNLRAPAGIMPLVAEESGRRASAVGKKRKTSASAGIADGVDAVGDADGERYSAAADVSVPARGKRRRVERVASAAKVLASGESGGRDDGIVVAGWERGVEAEVAENLKSSSSRAEESVGDPRATKRV